MTSLLNAHVQALKDKQLTPGQKGLALAQGCTQAQYAKRHCSILKAETGFPVAILKESALQHNALWMKKFVEHFNAKLAPHGKTTMSPELFNLQHEHSAWGMTLATYAQIQQAYAFGVRRILLANQLLAPAEIKGLCHLLKTDPSVELHILVDSTQGLDILINAAKEHQLNEQNPLHLLIELGMSEGRTGIRNDSEAIELGLKIKAQQGLALSGIEGYEGLFVTAQRDKDLNAVNIFLKRMVNVCLKLDQAQAFSSDTIILSAGGSAYFDLVAKELNACPNLSKPKQILLRSGCYLTHDHGFYDGLFKEMQARETKLFEQLPKNGLVPALEVWSMVQSRPEPDLAILTMGKRDASFDIHLPMPQWWHKPASQNDPIAINAEWKIEKMNDQHAYLRIPAAYADEVNVGDLIACGISHPCTTFDKWSVLLAVDDHYFVTRCINTAF